MPTPQSFGQRPTRPWAALGALSLSLIVVTIDNTVLNTALPTLARALRATTTDLQWITDAYTLVFASLLILAGGLAMRFGLRRAMIAGLVLFALGSAASGLAHGSGQLIALRGVMGLGAAFVMPATLASIIQLFNDKQRPVALSVWSAAAGLGVAVGPVVGGALLTHFFWGSVFWVNVPLVGVAVAAQYLFVPNFPARSVGRIDVVGAGLSILGLAALVDAVIEGPTRGWLSPPTLVEAAVAVAVSGAFVAWELRCAQPMIDVRLFTSRVFNVASAALAVTFFALFGALFVLTQYLQLVHGFSPLTAGLGALPFAAAMMATSSASSLVTKRLSARGSVTVGLTTMAIGLGGLGLAQVATPFWFVAVTIGLIGAGMGLVMAPASASTIASVPVTQAAAVASMNSVARELGGVLGIAVVGSVVSGAYRRQLHPALAHLGLSTHPALAAANQGITTAHVVATHLPAGLRQPLIQAANASFTSGMDLGVRVAAAAALAGAIAAGLMLHPNRQPTLIPTAIEELSPLAA